MPGGRRPATSSEWAIAPAAPMSGTFWNDYAPDEWKTNCEQTGILRGYRGYRRIPLPLLKPVLWVNITLAIVPSLKQMEPIYLMISIWNEFFIAPTHLTSDTYRTLPFSVYNFSGMYRSNHAAQFAVMVLAALPSLIVYIILNKRMTKGIVAGAVKG